MRIRPELTRMLWAGSGLMIGLVAILMAYCVVANMRSVHLAVIAVLTTSGPLIARVFEGLVRRRQRLASLDMNCLEADDEVLLARTVPLAVPVIGTLFAFFVVL